MNPQWKAPTFLIAFPPGAFWGGETFEQPFSYRRSSFYHFVKQFCSRYTLYWYKGLWRVLTAGLRNNLMIFIRIFSDTIWTYWLSAGRARHEQSRETGTTWLPQTGSSWTRTRPTSHKHVCFLSVSSLWSVWTVCRSAGVSPAGFSTKTGEIWRI